MVGDGPLAPGAVGEELAPRQQLDAADGVVDVLRLAEDAAGGDQPPQQGGVHVAQGRRVGAHEGDAGVEQVVLDPPLRRLVEGAARPHQLVGPQQVLGDVHVGPPVPLGGAVVGHRPGEGPVPLEDDLLPEGVVVVDAVAGVDLGEARQDEGGSPGEEAVAGGGVEARQVQGPAGEVLAGLEPGLGAEEVAVAVGVGPVGILLHLAQGVRDPQGIVVGVGLVGVADAAEPAVDLAGALDRPGELVLLGAAVAVGTAGEAQPRPLGDQGEHLRLRQGEDGLHGRSQPVVCVCGGCHHQAGQDRRM